MPRDPEADGALIVLTVKAALAPVLERVAELAQQTRDMRARIDELTSLRDRVVTVETKSAMPSPSPIHDSGAMDLSPLLARMVAVETLIKTQGDLRDRVLVMETKAA